MNKVVLLAPTPPPAGGIASWTVRMMNAELKNGWQVAVVDEKLIGKRQIFGDKTRRNLLEETKRCFQIWGNLSRELKDPNAKVVHSCIPSVPLAMVREYICACITKSKKRKFVIHFRCTVPNTTKGKFAHFMLKKLCDKSDVIMTLNAQTDAYLENITKTPTRLIPNFVSADELSESHEIREKIETVLYVGGVIESKGAMDMLEVAKRFPDIRFRLVGKSATNVEERAKELELENVEFAGTMPHEQVTQELQNADVFMFLTWFHGEGFSNSLAEAMAAGVPCLVTDWAANKDMIEDKGGFTVPIKSPEEAAQALEKMMSAEVRAAQSAFNIEKIRTAYADETVLAQYVDCYEELLK